MRSSVFLLSLVTLFAASPVLGRPLSLSERGVIMPDVDLRAHFPPPPPQAFANGGLGLHRLVRVGEVITYDPSNGATTARTTVELVAGPGGFRSLLLLIGEGLLAESVTDGVNDVPYDVFPSGNYQYIQPSLPQAAAEGEAVTLVFEYAGTLVCPNVFGASCDLGGERFDFVFVGSLFAFLYDTEDFGTSPYYERTLKITVPNSSDVYVSGNELSRVENKMSTTVDYIVPVRQDVAAYVGIFGQLATREVPGTSIPTRIIHLQDQPAWVDEMVGWTQSIVDFLDAQAGLPFPYPLLNVVKLPVDANFPGTAGPAMTLLSEVYGENADARYFEETLAHETSHVWWAVLTTDYNYNTRLLSEGLATFSQIDYTGTRIRTELDRDIYLGRRYTEMESVDLYTIPFDTLPPVVPAPGVDPAVGQFYTEWAYLKGAALLDLLRVSIGDEVFARGLRDYAAACADLPCLTSDFQAAMTVAAGEDLAWFFDQYIYANAAPRISIAFGDVDGGVSVTLSQFGQYTNQLELWLELEDGTIQKERVRLEEETTTYEFTTPQKVVRVSPNPRYEAVIRFVSVTENDIDFDRDLDGSDLVRCAYQVGRTAFLEGIGEGVTTGDVAFESRCDLDKNGAGDQADYDRLLAAFPEVF